MQSSPKEKHYGAAMPNASSKHGEKQVATSPDHAATTAAKWNVEVITEPSGERDVPSVPEVSEVTAAIGEEEVLAQTDSENGCNANADIAIATEVKVNLHGESYEPHQAFEARIGIWRSEYPVVVLCDVVCYDCFLDNAKDDEPKPQIKKAFAQYALSADLREESIGSSDRTCQQKREEREVEEIFQERNLEAEVASINIHGIADGLEGIEGNADGKRNARQREV